MAVATALRAEKVSRRSTSRPTSRRHRSGRDSSMRAQRGNYSAWAFYECNVYRSLGKIILVRFYNNAIFMIYGIMITLRKVIIMIVLESVLHHCYITIAALLHHPQGVSKCSSRAHSHPSLRRFHCPGPRSPWCGNFFWYWV